MKRHGFIAAGPRMIEPFHMTEPHDRLAVAADIGDLRARVADLNVWGAWLPPGWRLGGQLQTQFTASGRMASPQLSGSIASKSCRMRAASTMSSRKNA